MPAAAAQMFKTRPRAAGSILAPVRVQLKNGNASRPAHEEVVSLELDRGELDEFVDAELRRRKREKK